MFEIHQEFIFDAAHHFPDLPKGHKYHGVHGHSFRVVVTIAGRADDASGFVVDLEELERTAWRQLSCPLGVNYSGRCDREFN